MKKLFGFLFIVLLIILIIFFSNRYYSKKDKIGNYIEPTSDVVSNHDKVDLSKIDKNKSSDTNKEKEEIVEENKDSNSSSDTTTNNNANTNKNTNTNTTTVPDTASDDNSDYVGIDYYKVDVGSRNLKVGESTNIDVKIYPEDASEKDIIYSVEDSNICSVTSLGKVKTYSKGDCNILIKVKNANSYRLLIRVY